MEMNFFLSFFFNQGIKQYQFVVKYIYIYIYIYLQKLLSLSKALDFYFSLLATWHAYDF